MVPLVDAVLLLCSPPTFYLTLLTLSDSRFCWCTISCNLRGYKKLVRSMKLILEIIPSHHPTWQWICLLLLRKIFSCKISPCWWMYWLWLVSFAPCWGTHFSITVQLCVVSYAFEEALYLRTWTLPHKMVDILTQNLKDRVCPYLRGSEVIKTIPAVELRIPSCALSLNMVYAFLFRWREPAQRPKWHCQSLRSLL